MYFKLIFCVLYKDQISLFCMRIASFPTLFVEETVFSFYFFGTKDQLYMHGCIFILSVLLQCSIFPHLPSHHAFYYYCSFVIYLKLRSVRSPDLFLKIAPVIAYIFCIYMNFRIIFSISLEKSLGFW